MTLKLLAIDTATEQCSVALLQGDTCIERCVQTSRGHADLVLPMVQELLAEAGLGIAQLDAIAFGRGPGAFTGVRIAIGVAQGLAYATELPLLPVSDLAAVAQQGVHDLAPDSRILVCMDARMSEVYVGLFSVGTDNLVAPIAAERVCAPEQVQVSADELKLVMGMGLRAYPVLRSRYSGLQIIDDALPRAREIAQLAQCDWHAGLAMSAELAAPVYLRDRVTQGKSP